MKKFSILILSLFVGILVSFMPFQIGKNLQLTSLTAHAGDDDDDDDTPSPLSGAHDPSDPNDPTNQAPGQPTTVNAIAATFTPGLDDVSVDDVSTKAKMTPAQKAAKAAADAAAKAASDNAAVQGLRGMERM